MDFTLLSLTYSIPVLDLLELYSHILQPHPLTSTLWRLFAQELRGKEMGNKMGSRRRRIYELYR